MDAYITAPKMSEILWEEFMEPMGISAYKLAKAIHVPTSRIQDILHDRRKITYFLNIQNDIDLRELKVSMAAEIEEIRPYQTNKLAEVTVN